MRLENGNEPFAGSNMQLPRTNLNSFLIQSKYCHPSKPDSLNVCMAPPIKASDHGFPQRVEKSAST
jgi:hypothetical protein